MLARPNSTDLAVFQEFFTQLIGACGTAERRTLAATISTNAYVPRSIVLYLALDELEVAAPILLLSPVLKEADIVALARKLVPANLQVLCRRSDLTPAAVVSLLANGGQAVADQLSRNPFQQKAKSRHSGVDAAVAQPAANEARDPIRRADSMAAAKPARAPDSAPEKSSTEEQLLALAARGGRLGTNRAKPTPEPSRPATSDAPFGKETTRQLILTARAGDRKAVAEEIARHTGYATAKLLALLSGDGFQTLCVLLKGLGVDELQASQLILLLRPGVGRSREELSGAMRFYQRLNARTSRQFIDNFCGAPFRDGAKAWVPSTNLAEAIAERRREIAASGPMRPSARLASAAERPAMPGDRLKRG